MVTVNLLMPTLHPGLAARALRQAAEHGAEGVELEPVVVSHAPPPGVDCLFVREDRPRGVNAAMRAVVVCCRGEFVLAACDDVLFAPGWLAVALQKLLRTEAEHPGRPAMVGLRGGPVHQAPTCYGRLYATLPLFRRSVLEHPEIARHFMPPYLRGQWGDVAFGMALWSAGGLVVDSGAMSDGSELVTWAADRMGYPESRPGRGFDDDDTAAFRRVWHPIMGKDWPEDPRDFNVSCPVEMLRGGTIDIPHPAVFRRTLDASLP